MRLLDLFCGAGGESVGYHQAGFEVVGVDINDQPHYPYRFVQWDALTALDDLDWMSSFDVIHASPPCQTYSTLKTVRTRHVESLIEPVRHRLRATGLPYIIENVVGSPLLDPVQICGTALGCYDDEYELRRHRLFESNMLISGTVCAHRKHRHPVGVYGDLGNRPRPNRPVDGPTGPHGWKASRTGARLLMGIDWEVTDTELGEAIPPAYTRHLGAQLADHVANRVGFA